ncbi:hypothetical protein SHKM778_21670 [Streptomyces sp. KM77-8]|uniref:Kinase n=1 Tax=Streptomyces haneummycinicus TaxID=3074435 RepID=A0AAT9HEC4_9ACTN
MVFEPPKRLVRALGETAPEGDDWLERLPETAREAVAQRELTVERVQVPGGRSSLVVLVRTAEGTPAVLKLAPRRARPEAERAALAHWAGRGAVRLLEPSSAAEGVLLLERLHPDVSVRSLPEAKALLEAAGTLRRLWVDPPPEHGFETVAERTERQARAMRAGAAADPEAAPLVEAALTARRSWWRRRPSTGCCTGRSGRARCWAGSARRGWRWGRIRWSVSTRSTWRGWSGTGWRTSSRRRRARRRRGAG